MKKGKITLTNCSEQTIYGLWKKSNDRTIAKDIQELSRQYQTAVSSPKSEILPYFVLSRNYQEETRDFELFIGSNSPHKGLESLVLPPLKYAKITIKPLFGIWWGPSIQKAKLYFYRKWLPQSPYQPFNMEYELHTEESTANHPSIDLFFAIEKKVVQSDQE